MNILVTGGAGYIGSHVCLCLLDAGYDITVIDDLSMGHEKLIPDKVKFVKANINDTSSLNNLFQKKSFDALMHFAGFVQVEESVKYPEKYFNNNTKNATILFENCINNGLINIIFSSTAAVYGNPNNKLIIEETDLNPLNPYGESKVLTENKLRNMKKSQYIRISKTIIQKLNSNGCWGKGSMYENNLKNGIKEPGKDIDLVIKALEKQRIICSKTHKFGKKFYLNKYKRDKIGEIIKEKPRKRNSLLLILLAEFV